MNSDAKTPMETARLIFASVPAGKDYDDRLVSAVAQELSRFQTWRPMETAPLELTDVLLNYGGFCVVAQYRGHLGKWRVWQGDYLLADRIRGWMPLPTAA